MRVEQLECLIEIRKHKSINYASEILHMTPQGLSMSMKQLEKELGFKILKSSAIGTILTPEGNALVDAALTFIGSIKTLQSKSQKLNSFPLEITLYMPSGFFEGGCMLSMQAALYKLSPQSHIVLKGEPDNRQIITKVLTEEVEFAFVRKYCAEGKDLLQDIPPEIEFSPLLDTRYYCCASNYFPISRYKSISLKSMVKYPLILYEPTKELDLKAFSDICPLEQLKIIWAQNVQAYNEMLKSGLGVGIAFLKHDGNINTSNAMLFGKDLPDVAVVPIKENITLTLGYIVRRGKPLHDTTINLLNFIKEFFGVN